MVVGEYNKETKPVFIAKAKSENAPITFAQDNDEITEAKFAKKGGIDYKTKSFGTIHGELGGLYQTRNTNTILCVAKELYKQGAIKDKMAVATGLTCVAETTGLRGRWETVRTCPKVVCDTGHNVAGWEYLSRQIKNQPCKTLRIVFGMVDDKDINTVCELLPKNAEYYFTQASTHRAIPAERVRQEGERHGLKGNTYPTVKEAYAKALTDAGENDFIFIGGSSYVVADFLTD